MEFLENTTHIRNICILAHVDHGKTTIADSLIASNGIISQRLAGKMRYLDSQKDEQERGITMKSSSIALKYIAEDNKDKYLINLIDTPGHVDFCGEVSAAVRLCDGALIVIDVVEGVCPQTKVALEQAWKEGIEPILVLNKIDRMIIEQKLDETAAYLRLSQILEQVNAIVATLLTTEIFEDESHALQGKSNIAEKINPASSGEKYQDNQIFDWASAIEDIDDSKYYFMPQKNNVIFSSAIDDWAFTIESFAKIISEKYKINRDALYKTLWGDFYVDMKHKRILKNAQAKSKKNLFVSMILENIWSIYETIHVRKDKLGFEKICNGLGLSLTQRDINHTDSKHQIKITMSKLSNLPNVVLNQVSKIIPSPKNLSVRRVERLLCFNTDYGFNQLPLETQQLKKSLLDCSSSSNAVKLACVSKMFPFERACLPENRRVIRRPVLPKSSVNSDEVKPQTNLDNQTQQQCQNLNDTIFLSFARVFSGSIKIGDRLYVLGPRHDPSKITSETAEAIDPAKVLDDLALNEHVTIAEISQLYLFMGRELEEIDYACAGNIVGIRGLEKHIIRTATLSDNLFCPPFHDLTLAATPILRVAIEPKDPLEISNLTRGLKLLNQADPCVEVKLQDTGEHIIVATGEVHLQRCIKDLVERYTNNIELNVSPPIVSFRETIVLKPKIDMVNETIGDNNAAEIMGKRQPSQKDSGVVEIFTPNKKCKMRIKAIPLPESITDCLVKQASLIKSLFRIITSKKSSMSSPTIKLRSTHMSLMSQLKKELDQAIRTAWVENNEYKALIEPDFIDRILSFGPKYHGPNLLVADSSVSSDYSIWSILNVGKTDDTSAKDISEYWDSFISGFQLATQSGPLCEEPMMGVCFIIMEWSSDQNEQLDQYDKIIPSTLNQPKDSHGPMSGQIISTMRDCCRKAFQMQPQRLMVAMFSCSIKVPCDALGKMYAVLGKRNGRILHSDLREGSQTFEIEALLPVIESLDFVNEIRNQTSGMANPQLIFSRYELVDVDPFWSPTTEEEYSLFGEKADFENLARKYMNMVRRRKGLNVQEKIVEHGEKQRTIKRNK